MKNIYAMTTLILLLISGTLMAVGIRPAHVGGNVKAIGMVDKIH